MKKEEKSDLLDRIFFPESIAVIGASESPGKWGFMIVVDIIGGGFKGDVFPVNPGKSSILGLKAYSSIIDIPYHVDLAILTIPANMVYSALEECFMKGTLAAIIISSGFRETGSAGTLEEKRISELAEKHRAIFLGPNTMGTISAHHSLISAGAPLDAQPGGLSIISQSGNLGLQIMQWCNSRGLGLALFAGTGNEAILKTSDLLWYFGQRDEVKSIALYIEGIDNGREFMTTAREVTKSKPIVALKTGSSSAGSRAALSHSGSMAGSYSTCSAMFRQCGIIQTYTPSELINIAGAMANLPVPRSNRIGIMSLGGGWAIITADECERSGLVIPDLPADILNQLDSMLPSYWNRSNPIDMVGENRTELQINIMRLLAGWEEIDSVIALGIVGRVRYVEEFIACHEKIEGSLFSRELKLSVLKYQIKEEKRKLNEAARLQTETGKPIIAVSLGEGEKKTIEETESGNVMTVPTPEQAVNILSRMCHYRAYLKTLPTRTTTFHD